MIDVNGNISKTAPIKILFTEADQQEVTLSPVKYTVTPAKDKSLLVDVGDVFSSLSASDAIAINRLSNITWAVEKKDEHFLWTESGFDALNGDPSKVMYYDENMNGIDVSDRYIDENIKKIRYVKFIQNSDVYQNRDAKDGEHLISITINRDIDASSSVTGNRLVKKVNIPVHVVVPAWEDLFKTTTQWNGNTYITRLTNVDRTTGRAYISMDAFEDASTNWGGNINDNIEITKLEFAKADGREYDATDNGIGLNSSVGSTAVKLNYAELANDINNTHKLAFTEMSAKAEYVIGDVDDFTIEKEFTVQLKSIFEDAKLVYYVWNGGAYVANANAKMNAADVIPAGTVNADGSTISAEGLVLELNNYKTEVSGYMLDNANMPYKTLKANSIAFSEFTIYQQNFAQYTGTENQICIYNYEAQASGLTNATINVANITDINVRGTAGTIESGNGGSITLQFVDNMGVYTEASINFVKQ